MRYASTILYVPDVAAAVAFYERAFGLQQGFADPGGTYATLAGEGGALSFASHDQAAQGVGDEGRAAPAGFEVWIETDDVPGAVRRALDAGAELVQEPVEKPWGQTIAYVRDPNGTLVELGEPVG
jgi:lactoylglutathione lyase